METRCLSLPSAAWAEAERRAAASGVSLGEAVAAALLAAPDARDEPAEAKSRRALSDWAQLPEEVAQQAFRPLRVARDQGAVRATCRSWASALSAVVTSVAIREPGAVTSERTGRWRSLCPAAEELSVSVVCSESLVMDMFASAPGLEQLKRVSLSRDEYPLSSNRTDYWGPVAGMEALELCGFRPCDLKALLSPDPWSRPGSDAAGLLKFSALRSLGLMACEIEPRHLETLGKMTGLQELQLAGVHTWNRYRMGLRWLGQLTALKRLDLWSHAGLPVAGENDEHQQGLGALQVLEKLTGLEHLALSGLSPVNSTYRDPHETLTGDEVTGALLRMPKLKSFASTYSEDYINTLEHDFYDGLLLTDTLVWALAQLPCLERLVLSGHGHSLSPAGMEAMGRLHTLTELQVDIFKNRMDTEHGLVTDGFLADLRLLTNLHTLQLSMYDDLCSSEALTATLKKLSSLTSLTLHYDHLYASMWSDDELEEGWALFEHSLPALDLSFVAGTPELRRIDASESFLLVKNVGALQHAPQLESVVVCGMWDSTVPAASLTVEDLRGLRKLMRLETLDIDRAYTDEGVWSHSLDEYGDEAVRKAWVDLRSSLGLR